MVFVDSHTVQVPGGREFRGDAVVVAVGGDPGRPPIPGVELALTYEDLRGLTALPASAAVVGADTGCQLASILADFGVDVTLIEAAPRIVAHADKDASDALTESFCSRGIVVLTKTLVERLERTPCGPDRGPSPRALRLRVAVARYEDLVRPVIGDHPLGFCKLLVERHRRYILGAHVLGEYSAEVIQTVAACKAANLRIEQVAELVPAFRTFTEGITVAAQMIVRQMGIAPSAPSWGELRANDAQPGA